MGDVGTSVIAHELGYSARTVRNHAAAGKIPSAYRLTETSEWRFDLARVRAWKRQREAQAWRQPTSADESGGGEFTPEERNSKRAYEQALGLPPGSG